MAFVVERVGAVTGGRVDVSARQESVREAGVGIVMRVPKAFRPRDGCRLPVGCPLPPQQRRPLTGLGRLVAGSSERVPLLCLSGQHGGVGRTCPGLALTFEQVRLPRLEVTSPRVMRFVSSTTPQRCG